MNEWMKAAFVLGGILIAVMSWGIGFGMALLLAGMSDAAKVEQEGNE